MDTIENQYKVFISYCWTSKEHEVWVYNLALHLNNNGINPILDKWDLKPGQNKVAFMKKMVTDKSIDKVLIICDRGYKEKADNNIGGVGAETKIIAKDLKTNANQNKYIPIIAEKGLSTDSYLPNYLKQIIAINLSIQGTFEDEFKKLLESIKNSIITDKPIILGPLELFNNGKKINNSATQPQTIFNERLKHFREEKEFIASSFVPLLLERCKHHITKYQKTVYLIIDSGTTLFPFFEELGKQSLKLNADDENWYEKITIVTNHIAGLEKLSEEGYQNPNNRYSDLLFKCIMLPGRLLPIYSAVTGKMTVTVLHNIYAEAYMNDENPVFIGLTTGNWVRVRKTWPYCAIPLARGREHKEFKDALIRICHEIFVISPLGKIFVEVTKDQLNTQLNLNNKSENPDDEPYKEVDIDVDGVINKAKIVKLISTSRQKPTSLLRLHSLALAQTLKTQTFTDISSDLYKDFITSNINDIPEISFPFDYNQPDIVGEMEMELPHNQTRNAQFIKDFFHLLIDL